MKLRLIVMRHAKAGELPGGPDSERALRGRGRRDAAAAGRWLRDHGFVPDAVICSPARRTRQTWQYLAGELGPGSAAGSGGAAAGSSAAAPGGSGPSFTVDQRLYQADATDLLEVVTETPAAVTALMYIGHNPAAAQLAADLTAASPDFPTAAIAVIGLPGPWSSVAPGAGELIAAWMPGPDA